MHMKGRAENWFYGFVESHALVDWESLKLGILSKFGERMGYDLVEELALTDGISGR
ncbi:hypothetical protein Droror1_Dr00015847, partial [Drosera rotundifolia]